MNKFMMTLGTILLAGGSYFCFHGINYESISESVKDEPGIVEYAKLDSIKQNLDETRRYLNEANDIFQKSSLSEQTELNEQFEPSYNSLKELYTSNEVNEFYETSVELSNLVSQELNELRESIPETTISAYTKLKESEGKASKAVYYGGGITLLVCGAIVFGVGYRGYREDKSFDHLMREKIC